MEIPILPATIMEGRVNAGACEWTTSYGPQRVRTLLRSRAYLQMLWVRNIDYAAAQGANSVIVVAWSVCMHQTIHPESGAVNIAENVH